MWRIMTDTSIHHFLKSFLVCFHNIYSTLNIDLFCFMFLIPWFSTFCLTYTSDLGTISSYILVLNYSSCPNVLHLTEHAQFLWQFLIGLIEQTFNQSLFSERSPSCVVLFCSFSLACKIEYSLIRWGLASAKSNKNSCLYLFFSYTYSYSPMKCFSPVSIQSLIHLTPIIIICGCLSCYFYVCCNLVKVSIKS